jgi:ABC-type transport system substrate-binding protein
VLYGAPVLLAVTALLLSAAPPPAPELDSALAARTPPVRRVYVGAYLADVSDFDLKAGRFKADVHVWVKWLGDGPPPNLTFENAEVDSKEEEGTEDDGAWHAVRWRVQGTFRGEFPVHDFPFDRQTLSVVFGLPVEEGQLVPDLGASGMSPSFSVTGWAYEPFFTARSETRTFGSDLGSIAREGKNATLGLAGFSVELHRPFGPYLIKFALPLLLILLVAWLALFLPAERLDVRSAMGITGLLSCIAFHYTQADTLPAVTYLVAADQLFLGAYVFVSGTLLVSIVAYLVDLSRKETAQRIDRHSAWGLPFVIGLGLAVLISDAVSRAEVPEPAVPVNPHPVQPVLRVGLLSLESQGSGSQLPPRRGALVTRDSTGAFVPALAVEAPAMTNALVRLLPDGGMRVRWRLRADAAWSDGTRITAEDLAFSLGLVADPLRTGIERVDERTIDAIYADRRNEWLAGFTVFPAAAARQAPDAGRDELNKAHADGKLPMSGPWRVEQFEAGQRITLVRNERYAGPKPAYERVEGRVLEPLAAAKALLAGELDVVPVLTPDAYELLKNEPSVRVLEQPGDLLWALVPKLDVGPWTSLEARQALLSALDRRAMVDALAPAPARVASGWRAKPELEPAAGPTLASRGLTGQVVTLHVAKIRSGDEAHALLAKRVVEDLAKAGLTVTLVETPELFRVVRRGDFEGLALLGRDTAEPARFMNVKSEGGRERVDKPAGPHFDEEMVRRYERYASSLYAERRGALEESLQRAWFERLPMIPLVLTSRLAAVRAELDGPDWGTADSLWWNLDEWHPVAKE